MWLILGGRRTKKIKISIEWEGVNLRRGLQCMWILSNEFFPFCFLQEKPGRARWFDVDPMLCFEQFAHPKLVHNGLCFWLLVVL